MSDVAHGGRSSVSAASTRGALSDAERAAIEWEAMLRGGDIGRAEQEDFALWMDADINRRAWEALQRRLAPLRALQQQQASAVSAALRAQSPSRRHLLKAGFGGLALALSGLAVQRTMHHFGFDADWSSAVGQRRQLTLADGTQLLLDAQTRIYRTKEGTAPGMWVEQGQVLLRSAAYEEQTQYIATRHGLISARAAVLDIGRLYKRSIVSLAAGEATLTRRGQAPIAINAGDTLYFDASSAQHVDLSFDAASAWKKGLFVADRTTLAELFEAFNRYHPGFVQVVGDAVEKRISGVFRLDRLDQTLAQVCDNLPVRISHYAGYLTILS